jgi:hypothetical protein
MHERIPSREVSFLTRKIVSRQQRAESAFHADRLAVLVKTAVSYSRHQPGSAWLETTLVSVLVRLGHV